MRGKRRVRSRRLATALKVGALALVQLHLFFVLELHRHVLAPAYNLPLSHAVSQVRPPGTPLRPASLCAACQLARHGSVLVTGTLALPRVAITARIHQAQVFLKASLSHNIRSGRSPPASS